GKAAGEKLGHRASWRAAGIVGRSLAAARKTDAAPTVTGSSITTVRRLFGAAIFRDPVIALPRRLSALLPLLSCDGFLFLTRVANFGGPRYGQLHAERQLLVAASHFNRD